MKPGEVLSKAHHLVTIERANDHGDIHLSFARIAAMWEIWLGHPVTSHDVAVMMSMLKIMRMRENHHNEDNYIDSAGYMDIAGSLKDD